MSEKHSHHFGRSILAVLAGFIAVVALSTFTDLILHATGVFPPMYQAMSDPLWVLAAAYRFVYGMIGGYIAAKLAPDHPINHSLMLGGLGLIASVAGTIAMWNQGPAFGPHWFHVVLIAMAIPSAWLGGKFHSRSMIRPIAV